MAGAEQGVRVGVIGAYGRMGAATCAAVMDAADLRLAAQVGRGDRLETLTDAGVRVAVDFTAPDTVMEHVRWCVEHGIHVVVGTSGVDDERLATIKGWLEQADGVGVLVAPNFSIGAVLMMRFAAQAARHFDSVEVVELHHAGKVDAPSGTARRTADLIATVRRSVDAGSAPDATRDELPGARGADVGGVRVHSVRLPGLVAHQEVLLGGHAETLTIRHDSLDRSSFMPGVLLGIRRVSDAPGLTVGMEAFLDLG